jgi:tRNA threonylcarbamoyladenosine biosynthesis protein TsaE
MYHIDLYRLSGEEDLSSFGYEQYLSPEDGVTVIEWPERAGSVLPECYLLVTLDPTGPDSRRLVLSASSNDGRYDPVLRDLRSMSDPVAQTV